MFGSPLFWAAALALIGVASTKLFGMKDDNPVEELAEKGVKALSGKDVDLSPKSPEKKSGGAPSRAAT